MHKVHAMCTLCTIVTIGNGGGKSEMAHIKKSKYISFRVTEAQLKEIDMAATDAGLKAREWVS